MIGKLTGRLDSISLNAVIVDVGGVGYEVTVGAHTLTSLPPVGESVTFAIDTHVREDEIRLFGFATEHERAWFKALQTVQGVGARIALAVLGTLSAAELANAVALQDKGQVARSKPFRQSSNRRKPAGEPEGRRQAWHLVLELGNDACGDLRPHARRARDLSLVLKRHGIGKL